MLTRACFAIVLVHACACAHPEPTPNHQETYGDLRTSVPSNQDTRVSDGVKPHVRELQACYEQSPDLRSAKGGTMTFAFTIDVNGEISDVHETKPSGFSAELMRCAGRVVERFTFAPVGTGGEPLQVTYPFTFAPVGR